MESRNRADSERFSLLVKMAMRGEGQRDVAQAVGVSQTTIHNMLKGRIPSRPVVEAFARAMGLDGTQTDDLLLAAGHKQWDPRAAFWTGFFDLAEKHGIANTVRMPALMFVAYQDEETVVWLNPQEVSASLEGWDRIFAAEAAKLNESGEVAESPDFLAPNIHPASVKSIREQASEALPDTRRLLNLRRRRSAENGADPSADADETAGRFWMDALRIARSYGFEDVPYGMHFVIDPQSIETPDDYDRLLQKAEYILRRCKNVVRGFRYSKLWPADPRDEFLEYLQRIIAQDEPLPTSEPDLSGRINEAIEWAVASMRAVADSYRDAHDEFFRENLDWYFEEYRRYLEWAVDSGHAVGPPTFEPVFNQGTTKSWVDLAPGSFQESDVYAQIRADIDWLRKTSEEVPPLRRGSFGQRQLPLDFESDEAESEPQP